MIKNDRFFPPVPPAPPAPPNEVPSSSPPPKKKSAGGWRVPLVQSIACVVVVLVALLMRSVGGDTYRQLRDRFQEGLMRNDWMVMLSTLWDSHSPDSVSVGEPEGQETPIKKEESASSTEPSESTQSTEAEESSEADEEDSSATVSPTVPAGVSAMKLRVNFTAYRPLAVGQITSAYGFRDDPLGEGIRFHRGMDIAAPAGTPIAAMFFGTVTATGTSSDWGNYIRLNHGDGVEVLYAHCSRITVEQGTVVRAGETVALVGTTGRSTGNHVHIQISCNQTVYNPSAVVPVSRYA